MCSPRMCVRTVVVAQIVLQPPPPKRSALVYYSFPLFLILLLSALWDAQDVPLPFSRDGDGEVYVQVEASSST